MLAATTERVWRHTAPASNDEITRQMREELWRCLDDGADRIDCRLEELDHEWDVERVLEVNASLGSLLGVALGATVDRRFFALPAVIGAFLLQHALNGWCPPLPLLRRLGVRTQSEIERERYALKALRGDFNHTEAISGRDRAPVQQVLEAVNL